MLRNCGAGVLLGATVCGGGAWVPAGVGARAVIKLAGNVAVEPAVRGTEGETDAAGLGGALDLAVPDGDVGQIGLEWS